MQICLSTLRPSETAGRYVTYRTGACDARVKHWLVLGRLLQEYSTLTQVSKFEPMSILVPPVVGLLSWSAMWAGWLFELLFLKHESQLLASVQNSRCLRRSKKRNSPWIAVLSDLTQRGQQGRCTERDSHSLYWGSQSDGVGRQMLESEAEAHSEDMRSCRVSRIHMLAYWHVLTMSTRAFIFRMCILNGYTHNYIHTDSYVCT